MITIEQMTRIGQQRLDDEQARYDAEKAANEQARIKAWQDAIQAIGLLLPEALRTYIRPENVSGYPQDEPGMLNCMVIEITGYSPIKFRSEPDHSALYPYPYHDEPSYFKPALWNEITEYWNYDAAYPTIETALAVAKREFSNMPGPDDYTDDQSKQPDVYTLTTTELLIKALTAFIQEQQA